MIDLCKVFGVEEGEEFKIDYEVYMPDERYKIENNQLYKKEDDYDYELDGYCINDLRHIKNIIKLPKRKEFTDDELAIMRSLPKEYKWMARDKVTYIVHTFVNKPKKSEYKTWESEGYCCFLSVFSHVFNSIQWEDEEPVFIDDYVERGTE